MFTILRAMSTFSHPISSTLRLGPQLQVILEETEDAFIRARLEKVHEKGLEGAHSGHGDPREKIVPAVGKARVVDTDIACQS